MKKRTKLCDRVLPQYSRGEERMNMITHIVGGGLGTVMLLMCVIRAAYSHNTWGIVTSVIYGVSLIALYTVSSVYHGMKTGTAKKVMQVIDHCTIYFLIAGSYTVVVLSALRPVFPVIAWGLFIFVWTLTVLAVILTAIDLKKYSVFSMICYVGMGWCVIPFWRQTLQVLTAPGFLLLLAGGIAYTIGAVLYGLAKGKSGCTACFISLWCWEVCCSFLRFGCTRCKRIFIFLFDAKYRIMHFRRDVHELCCDFPQKRLYGLLCAE